MISLKRCESHHPDYSDLIKLLDQELENRYDDFQEQYNTLNNIGFIETVVVAYNDDNPVGCGCFSAYDDGIVEMKQMFVKKEERGKRIATLILLMLELWAADMGYKIAILETGIAQAEAIGFYVKSGYELIPNFGQYIGKVNSFCFHKVF